MDIGAKIKRIRLSNQLTLEELANRSELTKGFLSQLERDLTSPSVATLENILEALGTNLKDFFSEDEDEQIVFSKDDFFENIQDDYKISYIIPNAQKNEMEPILIELKKDDSVSSLSHLIHSAFPEPTILIYKRTNTYYISLASKRINKIEQGKTVVEDVVVTQIPSSITFEQISLENIPGINLREYYNSIINWFYKLKVLHITKVYPQKDLGFKTLLKQYEQTKVEINKLKEAYKKASMKSDKMRIDDELYDKEIESKKILKLLKEGE